MTPADRAIVAAAEARDRVDMDVRPTTPAEQTVWGQMLAELPSGVRPQAVRWRDGSYQVAADLPHHWHRPHSRISQQAYGTGRTLPAAITEFRAHLAEIRHQLGQPGQALWQDPAR